jgi:glycosyltransferase involved in cell wall biosynthesis
VIVVDDGSTDESRDIIYRYGDRVIPVLKENGGQASALNAGFAAICGDIVMFLDADDALLPDAVHRVMEAFDRSPETAKVQYRMEVIDAASRRTGIVKPPHHIPLLSGDLRRHELLFPFDLAWLPTSGNAFAAKILRRTLPVPEQAYGRVGADWYLAHLTPLFGPVTTLDAVCAFYRVHGSNHYEPASPALDLAHIRQTIHYSDITRRLLKEFADQLGLPDQPDEILAVSYLANRITSLKLEPAQHPIAGDTGWNVLRLAMRAIPRRFDVSWMMKSAFALWFALMTLAPQLLARWLAEIFLFPEKRSSLNPLLSALHKSKWNT